MVRFTYKYLKPIALFLSIMVLFQCCKVYDKRPVSIDQALNVDHSKVKRIKVDMFGSKKLVLDSIYYKNGEPYGLLSKSTKKNLMEEKIEEEEIIKILLYNQKKSTTATVFAVVVPVTAGLALFIAIAFAFSSPFPDGI